ncbi:MAG: HD domain-containing protein [Pseudomonadota bacterium]
MKCPGQDPRFWKFDAIFEAPCPKCGASVEFFKDETRRTCKGCGHKVLNPKMDFGCAAHCKFAEACFGELPPEIIRQRQEMFKDRVGVETKKRLQQDFKRIAHAAKVARYAEKLAESMRGDPAVVLSAAHLHDLAPGGTSCRHLNPASVNGREEAADVARAVLDGLEAPHALTAEVCAIVERLYDPGTDESANFKSVHDADLIAALEEQQKKGALTPDRLELIIEKDLLTNDGRELARSVLFPAAVAG